MLEFNHFTSAKLQILICIKDIVYSVTGKLVTNIIIMICNVEKFRLISIFVYINNFDDKQVDFDKIIDFLINISTIIT